MLVNKKKALWWFYLIILLLSVSITYSAIPEEYLGEFNNTGEKCTFEAEYKFFQNNEYNQIYFYKCCNLLECVYLPFNLDKQSFDSSQQIDEYFRISYAIENVNNGTIDGSAYQYTKGFDLCSFYNGEFEKQVGGLVADGVGGTA